MRYGRLLRALGHRARVLEAWDGGRADVLIVLNAQRGARSILRARRERPELPIVVVVTGTDVYTHLGASAIMARALDAASRIVGLQSDCLRVLGPRWRPKSRAILQSYDGPRLPHRVSDAHFDFALLGHLRAEKDPFRAALAARRLPAESRVRVLHAGKALKPALGLRARSEGESNPRYRWLGPLSRRAALTLLSKSRALILSSRIEGGPGVFSEALALGVPILASRIPASVSILSARHPGLFTAGNSAELAALMRRAECEPRFLARLAAASRRLAPQFEPAVERAAWKQLLAELQPVAALRSRAVEPARRAGEARRSTTSRAR